MPNITENMLNNLKTILIILKAFSDRMLDKSVTIFGISPFLQIQEINFFKQKTKKQRRKILTFHAKTKPKGSNYEIEPHVVCTNKGA